MRPAAVVLALLTVGACWLSSDFIVRRLLLWIVTIWVVGS